MMENKDKTQIAAVANIMPTMETTLSDCPDETENEAKKDENEEEPARGNWTGRFDFLLSLLGYSVGLGNVWRFPYLCYNNGGGAFLIPFTVMLVIAGLPLMFMELSFGQFAALGPVAVYNKFCPLFRGLGYGMVIVSSIVMLYYNLIIAWTIYYMAVSFMSIFYQLPWQNCDADWSTKNCYSYEEADACEALNGTYYLRQCLNQSYVISHNITALAKTVLRRPPAEEYFTNQVLGLSSGIEETGQIRPGMAICLLAAWLIVFLCLCKGVQSSGKVVYFTALFPYVVLVILFFRGVTLPGASTGILFYLTPDFSQLLNAQVWGDAAVQIFFALSPAWGGLITLSSYNKFSNNCYIDSLIVAASNIATSFFAGLVIFSVIGFLAHELDVGVDRVVDQGAGLAFIVYPEVVTRLPVSPLWSILFFVMLLTLGLDSQFALMETVTTAILDRFPNLRQKKVWVVFTVAVFGYLGGLIFTTNSGMYWLQLMDKYAANWSVLIIAIGECILIAWRYGAEKFCGDIQSMIGKQSKLWVFFWSAMWRVITPSALVFILVFNWIEYKPASYGHYVYPMWADAVGWTLGVLPVVVVVLMAVDQICSGPDDLTIMEKARALSRPTEEWGHHAGGTTALLALRPPAELSPPVLLLHGRPVLRERGTRPPHAHPLVAMRKTSQDGEYHVTSAVENEVKKPKGLLSELKTKKIGKRTAPNLSEESDDAVVEPLLQKSTNSAVQSAKYLAKAKAETVKEITKLFNDKKTEHASTLGFGTTDSLISEKNQVGSNSKISNVPQHNHMNTNVFHSLDNAKVNGTAKTQVLVEIDGSKQSGFNPSPLIFTTAKIHTDGKPNHMEPIQMTPAPIISTIEVSVSKSGSIIANEKNISNGSSIMNQNTLNSSTTVTAQNSLSNSDINKMTTATNKPDKTQLNYPLKTDSPSSTSKLTTAANINIAVSMNSKDNNKILSEPSISEMPKSNIVEQTKKFPLAEIKVVQSSAQLPFVSQTHKKEKPNTIDSDSKLTNKDRERKEREAKTLIAINIKPIVIDNQTSSSKKPLEPQKNITATEDLLKIETKMGSSKIPHHDSPLSAASLNIISKADLTDLIVSKTHAITPKTTATVINTINSNANKVENKTTKTVSSTTDTAISSTGKTKASTSISVETSLNANKTQAATATSVADKPSTKAEKTQTLPTKAPISIPDKSCSNATKTQPITAKAATAIANKASTNSNRTQAVTTTSVADKPNSKTDKTQTFPTKAPTLIPDKASSNANKTQSLNSKVVTTIADKAITNANKPQSVTTASIGDKANSIEDKTPNVHTKAPISISDETRSNRYKTQVAALADKTGSNTNKSQIVNTKAAMSTGDPTSSRAKPSPASTTKSTATSAKIPSKPLSVSTVAKTPTNKSPSTTPSAMIAQVTSPGSTTATHLVGKTTQVSTRTTKPTGITSPSEQSNKTKTNESSNKIGSKSSDQTKDHKVTKG